MEQQKQKRNRGLILTRRGWQKLQDAKVEKEFQENSGDKYTIEELSERVGITPVTWRKVLTRETGVDKQTIVRLFMEFNLELDKSDYTQPEPDLDKLEVLKLPKRIDWGEAVCVSAFYGRTAELNTLEQWLIKDRCRVVTLLGMGGIGKTCLAAKLAEQVQEHFEYVIWRSLYNAPPLLELLATLIRFFSDEQVLETDLPNSVDGRISQLIDYLQKYRCLIILDNAETILASGAYAGWYREGYEDYGQLIKRVGEVNHTSSLLLTSREKPKDVASLEGQALPVRSFQLCGLEAVEGEKIFKVKGCSCSETELRTVVERYAGNALALKIVATTINDVFNGNVSEFLKQDTVVFGDIRHLLNQQEERLSSLEREVMYWLAINREPVSLSELLEDILLPIPPLKLLEALESLSRRCLIEKAQPELVEKNAALFTLQPVVIEYMTNRLVDEVCSEIETEKIDLFRCYALMKATAKDYVRDTQIRLILQPVINGLLAVFRSKRNLENQLNQTLAKLREKSPLERSYTAGNIFNLLCHLETDLTGYDFSYLSVWQADMRCLNLYDVNFAHADLAKSVFAETFGGILSVAFSPDGKFLVTGDMNGEIRLYQVADWKQLFTYKGHADWVTSIAFSPDSRILASGSDDQTIKLWNVTTGECLRILCGHEKGIWSIAFNSNGQVLASGSDDKTIKIWDVSDGKCLKTLQGHNNFVRAVIFSPDNQILFSGSVDKTLKLWDVKTGQCLRTFQGHDDAIWSATLSPDGRILVSASGDQTLKLWDVKTGQCLRTLPGHSNWVFCVTFNPDGQILASSSWDQTVKLWDVSTGQCLRTLPGHNNLVRAVVFSPDGQMLASGSDDQSLKLWDVATGECLKTLQGYGDRIWSIALSPDEQMLASSSDHKTVKIWDMNTDQCLRTFTGHNNVIRSVTFNPKGDILASGSDDKTIRMWDIDTGNCYRILQGHTSWVWSIAFSPDGHSLASGSHDQTVKLWDVSDGKCLKTLHQENHGVLSVTFSPDGQTLASGSTDYTVKLWNVKTGQCLNTLQGHTGWIWSIAFSSNGKFLCSTSQDHTVKLWDVSDGKCLKTLQGHSGWVWSVVFSPDEQTLITGSTDQTVKLWNVSDGKCLKTLREHTRGILSLTFSPKRRTIISGSEDETIKIWDVSTGECIRSLRSKKPYEGMKLTGVIGLTEAKIATLKTLGAIEHELDVVNNK
ncbi:MAG: NB-ARC domain-containing protein [Rhizonema sp. NSF051]|nr:NB-ARC domain-containing protein [Rhizonema sp. NSF051]